MTHKATPGSTRVGQEREGVRGNVGKAFIVDSMGKNG